MAKENKPTATAATAPVAGNPLFGAVDETKFVRRNIPQMIRLGEIPVGSSITGEITGIIESPVSTVKGKLLTLKHPSGIEFSLPCVGDIRTSLVPGIKRDDDKALVAALQKEIGKQFAAKRLPDRVSAKAKKSSFKFDVFTTGK